MPDTSLSVVAADTSQQRAERVTLLERKAALAEIAGHARGGDGQLVLVEGRPARSVPSPAWPPLHSVLLHSVLLQSARLGS
jgi:hypothetical protein